VRVVFDTNIYISAIVVPGGAAQAAFQRILEGRDVLLLSKEILDETLAVLSSKFSRDREALSRVAVFLSEISERVKPEKNIRVFQDDPDNRILEGAVAGAADAIVTGDKKILQLREYFSIRIIPLKQFTGPTEDKE
jgi:uncharacterized protein